MAFLGTVQEKETATATPQTGDPDPRTPVHTQEM